MKSREECEMPTPDDLLVIDGGPCLTGDCAKEIEAALLAPEIDKPLGIDSFEDDIARLERALADRIERQLATQAGGAGKEPPKDGDKPSFEQMEFDF